MPRPRIYASTRDATRERVRRFRNKRLQGVENISHPEPQQQMFLTWNPSVSEITIRNADNSPGLFDILEGTLSGAVEDPGEREGNDGVQRIVNNELQREGSSDQNDNDSIGKLKHIIATM